MSFNAKGDARPAVMEPHAAGGEDRSTIAVRGEVGSAVEVTPVEVSLRVVVDRGATDGYVPLTFNTTRLTTREATAFQRLFASLQSQHVQLPDGLHVDRPGRALRYLLNQLADQLDPPAKAA